MHSTFGPPAKFVFTRASKLTEDSNDEPTVGDRYAIQFNVERLWEPLLYKVCFPLHMDMELERGMEYVVAQKVRLPI